MIKYKKKGGKKMSISEIVYNGAGAGIRHAYPYTDFHEMNLDWLLTTYQSIVDKNVIVICDSV